MDNQDHSFRQAVNSNAECALIVFQGYIWYTIIVSAVFVGVFSYIISGILYSSKGDGTTRSHPTETIQEVSIMFIPKGFYTSQGYVGFLPDGSRMIFPTSEEYAEYVRELEQP